MTDTQPNFQATLMYLRVMIDLDLRGRAPVQKGYLSQAVADHGARFNLDAEQHERYVKYLETVYGTEQDDGHLLRGMFKEWFPQSKGSIDFHYWKRLEKHWRDSSILPVDVIRSVDTVTDEILGYAGNPKDKTGWNRRRGLVMGHVQMGKTTNYSALISKAADSGYRIIIVLAGLTNSLRYQTQVRLDKSFVGKSSISDSTHSKIYDVSRVFLGEVDGYIARHPFCGTTQISDFNTISARTTGAHEGNFADPILFVTKKHPKVLERLADWLKGLKQGEKLDGPMLLIDDEADNASVNTSKDPKIATMINQRIRDLLHTTKQSTYIGYTATPFANIFIDPDSTDGLDREDLFPADFIKSLEPPTNYVGASRLFGEGGDLSSTCVRPLAPDYANLLPIRHTSALQIMQLPPSLVDALREYVLLRTIRIAGGHGSAHSAMLINVSRFNNVQEQVRNLVDTFRADLGNAIDAWATADWTKSDEIKSLKRVWDAEYSGKTAYGWDEIRPLLTAAVGSISSHLVNMKGTGIDYEKAPSTGLHVVAIGGLALARGLTLEGLSISYVLRKVGASDTLLQMGRWFGYRPGFENLCRIHATSGLIADFREVSESVEELRVDFERMARLGKTPFEFGLKVRQSSTGIAITAANKMRSAKALSLAEDFSTRHLQAHTVYDDDEPNRTNRKAVDTLRDELKKAGCPRLDARNALVWTGVDARRILAFLRNLELPQTEFNVLEADGSSLVTAYIEDRASGELRDWDVAIPFVAGKAAPGTITFPYGSLTSEEAVCRVRHSGKRETKDLVKITGKGAVGFGTDDFAFGEDLDTLRATVKEALDFEQKQRSDGKAPPASWGFAVSRQRPLLTIHMLDFMVDAKADADGEKPAPAKLSRTAPVVTITLLFPATNVECRERVYQASARLLQMLKELRAQDETDEEFDDE